MTWFIIYLIAVAIVLPYSLILVSVNRTDDYDDIWYTELSKKNAFSVEEDGRGEGNVQKKENLQGLVNPGSLC
ncbi:MAG TPA: hypothetical protein ENG03_01295 [Thioploca sp.]|nr:MAG: hypothetical protein B6247_19465 [Beggiatoa sp. 4572_84]RKZ60392.1 MAG: hypothetical protein DRR08_11465 [Gammaproteobacteria bacterium]HDN25734.1 hypothetical protein [Thioploca sp.]